jgi:hypothetical protein
MQTKYYLITNKENTAIVKTIAVNKKIRVRNALKNGKVKESILSASLDEIKRFYDLKEITYNQFLFFQYL